jgi:hypothetical protein
MTRTLLAIAAATLLAPVAAATAAEVREERPNAVGVELLGASGVLSITGELQIAPRLGLTFGLAPWARIGDDRAAATLGVPVGLRLHPVGDEHGLTFSVNALVTPAPVNLTEHGDTYADGLFPRFAAGAGYQLQLRGGFDLRGELYLAATRDQIWRPTGTPQAPERYSFGPWAGLFLGYAF